MVSSGGTSERVLLLSVQGNVDDASASFTAFRANVQGAGSDIDAFQSSLSSLQATAAGIGSAYSNLASQSSEVYTGFTDLASGADDAKAALQGVGDSDVTGGLAAIAGGAGDADTSLTDMASGAVTASSGVGDLADKTDTGSSSLLTFVAGLAEGSGGLGDLASQGAGAAQSMLGLDEGLGSVVTDMLAAAGPLAAVAAGLEAAHVGVDTFNADVGTLSRMSDAFGITTAQAQGLRATFEDVGISGDKAQTVLMRMQTGLAQVQTQMDAGKEPTGRFVDGLNAMGISVQSFMAADPTGRLNMIMAGFQQAGEQGGKFSNGVSAATVATDLFGRAGAQAVPGLEGLGESFAANTAKAGEYNDASAANVLAYRAEQTATTNLDEAMTHFGVAIGSAVVPVLTTLTGLLTGVSDALNTLNSDTAASGTILATYKSDIDNADVSIDKFILSHAGLLTAINPATAGIVAAAEADLKSAEASGSAAAGADQQGAALDQLSQHLSSGTTFQNASNASTGDATKARLEGIKADTAAAQGKTDLADAERQLQVAYEGGNKTTIQQAQDNLTLVQAQDSLASATQTTTDKITSLEGQRSAAIDAGKTHTVEALNAEITAYQNGDLAAEKSAAAAVTVAGQKDAAAKTTEATYQREVDAANKASVEQGAAVDKLQQQYSSDLDKMGVALDGQTTKSQADWQAQLDAAQASMPGQLQVVADTISQIEQLKQDETGVMSDENRKQLDDQVTSLEGQLTAAQKTYDAEAKSADEANKAITASDTKRAADAKTLYDSELSAAKSVYDQQLAEYSRMTAAMVVADGIKTDSWKQSYLAWEADADTAAKTVMSLTQQEAETTDAATKANLEEWIAYEKARMQWDDQTAADILKNYNAISQQATATIATITNAATAGISTVANAAAAVSSSTGFGPASLASTVTYSGASTGSASAGGGTGVSAMGSIAAGGASAGSAGSSNARSSSASSTSSAGGGGSLASPFEAYFEYLEQRAPPGTSSSIINTAAQMATQESAITGPAGAQYWQGPNLLDVLHQVMAQQTALLQQIVQQGIPVTVTNPGGVGAMAGQSMFNAQLGLVP